MTFIRRLEMRGFKSFGARPIAITFEPGFTVITGPNGSGKSNIADAILFAIGENSPKQLRAANGRLSGVIYDPKKEDAEGGFRTGEDRPTSCRVTIEFDNSNRAIPLDSDVAVVTRELKETGDNYYFINGKKTTKTALGEILDIAGLSPGGLNIVPQGAATRVADLTPEEKRRIIEDVVGIAKFDEKKSEAQRQLSQADQRLEVALARIGEMRSTLATLDLQRNDLVRHNLLENHIGWLRAVKTSARLMELRGKVASLRGQEVEMKGRIQELVDRRLEFENRISQADGERTRFIVEVVQGGGASHVDLQFQLAQVDNELQTLQGDLRDAEANMKSLEDETIPSLKQIVKTKGEEMSVSNSTVDQLASELSRLDERRKDLIFWLEEIVEAEAELRETIDKKLKQRSAVELKISETNQKLSATDLLLNSSSANLSAEKRRVEELKQRVDSYSEVLKKLEGETKELFELFEGSRMELDKLDEDLSTAEKRRVLLLGSVEQASRILEKATEEVLKEEAYRSVSESVAGERAREARLQELCEGGGVRGYVGRLNQLVEFPQQYSKATAAILGRWRNSFVVKDLRSMTSLIKAAKSLGSKSFSVVPLSEVEGSVAAEVGRSGGVVGTLSRLLKCDEKYECLVNFLAGDAVVVESEAAAYIVAAEGVKAVTLSGEVFERGGRAFSHGFQDAVLNLLEGLEDIEGVSEIEEAALSLKKAIRKRKEELEGVELGQRSASKARVRRIASIASLRAEGETIKRISGRYTSAFKSMSQEYERQVGRVERLSAKQVAITSRRGSLEGGLSRLRGVVESIESLRLDELLQELESSRKSLEGEADYLRNRIAEVNLSYTREKANLENVLQRTLRENQLDLDSALDDYRQSKVLAQEAPRRIKELAESKESLETQIEKLKESSRQSQPVLDDFERKIRRLKGESEATSRSITSAEREQFSLHGAIASTDEKIEEALGGLRILGYNEPLETFEESESLLSELEKEYETVVSSVNKGAGRQYREMYESYKNLSVRHNELERERNSIIGFIESVEGEKKKVFITAFAKIREEFGFIFKRLTNGEAWLELEDEEEVFSGGLRLMARFGLKPAWESVSLSGGEKAVTGVALILAMQSVQPHPFYLLDEIDSHLDAVNSANLAQFLKERSAASQIVTITLRDVLIASSDLTHGVYAAGGVSRYVNYRPAAEVPIRHD